LNGCFFSFRFPGLLRGDGLRFDKFLRGLHDVRGSPSLRRGKTKLPLDHKGFHVFRTAARFMEGFRNVWIKTRLTSMEADTAFIEESIFMSSFQAFAKRGNITRGSPEDIAAATEKWWTRFYQPVFVPSTKKVL